MEIAAIIFISLFIIFGVIAVISDFGYDNHEICLVIILILLIGFGVTGGIAITQENNRLRKECDNGKRSACAELGKDSSIVVPMPVIIH